MAWVESHQDMERHEKTLRLRKLVGKDAEWVLGFMHRFWWWALDAAPDGVVTFLGGPGMLAAAFGYDDEFGDKVFAALIESGWLDRSPEGDITIHNHDEYRGRLTEIREDARLRQQRRRNRLAEKKVEESENDGENAEDDTGVTVTDMSRDCHDDVTGMSQTVTQMSQQPNTTQHNNNPNTTKQEKALSPEAQGENKQKALKGGAGENAAPTAEPRSPPGFLDSFSSGFRAEGFLQPPEKALPCGGFGDKEVFDAFFRLFAAHSLFTLTDFFNRVRHCGVTPAEWTMLYLDKIHRLYRRDAEGKTFLDHDDADPVAMTVSGFRGTPRHAPTDAARQLFAEIMLDHARAGKGERVNKWNGNLSCPAVAVELDRRKGRKGKT